MIEIYNNLKLEKKILNSRLENIKKEEVALTKIIKDKEVNIKLIANHLKELKGIENELYYQIVVLGKNVTKAVDKVAFSVDKDVSTIWKNYYPKVKKKLKELDLLAKVK